MGLHLQSLLAIEEIQRFGIFGLAAGVVLILFGRKLFWFLVAVAGFYAGMALARELLHLGEDWHAILIGICCGIAGVFLVTAVQKLAIGIFGFIAGAFLVTTISVSYHIDLHWWWILIGGIICAFIAGKLFQIGLIVLSSVLGAYMVTREVSGAEPFQSSLLYFLALVGLVVQFSMWKSSKDKRGGAAQSRPEPPKPEGG